MSLRDPKNPAVWADGTPRSQGNVFDTSAIVGAEERLDTAQEDRRERARKRSTRQVEIAHAKGKNLSVGALRDATRRPKVAA